MSVMHTSAIDVKCCEWYDSVWLVTGLHYTFRQASRCWRPWSAVCAHQWELCKACRSSVYCWQKGSYETLSCMCTFHIVCGIGVRADKRLGNSPPKV